MSASVVMVVEDYMSSAENDSIMPMLEDMDKHIQECIAVFNKPWHDTDRLMKLYNEYKDVRIAAAEWADKARVLYEQLIACVQAIAIASDMYADLYDGKRKGGLDG